MAEEKLKQELYKMIEQDLDIYKKMILKAHELGGVLISLSDFGSEERCMHLVRAYIFERNLKESRERNGLYFELTDKGKEIAEMFESENK